MFAAVDWRSEAEGVSRTGGVPKAVLTVEQGGGRQAAVVLWGTALTWLQHIHTNKGMLINSTESHCIYIRLGNLQ